MRTILTPQNDVLHIGDKVLHKAEGQDFTGELIDIDLNQLHGLVRYEGEPHEGEEQWVPQSLLSPVPVAPEPAPESETPVRDAMVEAGKEALAEELAPEQNPS